MASVVLASLKATMEFEIQQPSPRVLPDDLKQMRSLIQHLSTLQAFMKKFHIKAFEDAEIKSVENQIKDVSLKAEDEIDIQLRNILLAENAKRKEDARREIHGSLEEIRKNIDELLETVKQHDGSLGDSSQFPPDEDTVPLTPRKEEMVGNREELKQILDQLKCKNEERQIISISGMGGIGKTTLARTIYDDPVTNHFDVRAWTTMSQQYEGKQTLIALLRCITTLTPEEIKTSTKEDLKDRLQKLLKGRRYLIVVDDVWSHEAWDDIKLCFPTDTKGSILLLTTRDKKVARDTHSGKTPYGLKLLNKEDSWFLFSRNLDFETRFPKSLGYEGVGKEIAKQCKGLPLSIVVVAGILISKVSLGEWENIQKELALILTVDEQCTKIPALSYKHLPSHLKPCFLHLGVFPEDSEMPVKKLVRLWIAEGFVKVVNGKALKDMKKVLDDIEKKLKYMEKTAVEDMDRTLVMDKALQGVDKSLEDMDNTLKDMGRALEDTALEYLQALISKSLVLIRNQSSNGEVKTCRMHDLLHDFCVNKGEEENLLYAGSMRRFRTVKNSNDDGSTSNDDGSKSNDGGSKINDDDGSKSNDGGSTSNGESVKHKGFRWLTFWPNYGNVYICYNLDKSRSLSFLHRDAIPTLIGQCLPSNLLRVLDLIELPPLSNEIFMSLRDLVLLRYMDIALDDCLSSEELVDIVSRTQNLQTLIISQNGTGFSDMCLPSNLLESPQLRHVEVSYALSLDPPSEVKEALHTLYWLSLDHCTEEVFSRIPNVKKLGIICGSKPSPEAIEPANLENLGSLDKLETLMIAFRKGSPTGLQNLESLPLNLNIKKLKLKRTCLPWSEINVIGMLPNLEVLKLKQVSDGPDWEPTEGNFRKLKFLYLEAENLESWEVDGGDQFRCLTRLVLKKCTKLEGIPTGFEDVNTLASIELLNCPVPVKESAQKLNEHREDYGIEPIIIRHVDQIQEVDDVEDDDDDSSE
ncbi:PREDICTED: putative late blight resistance protein homolog R1B-16 [Ipomoea nil]|uniref:putative late blight resistance protein homolog R1B-16 n=1 Tax=Ipomoea nil TaxID=35883 RepID=UPI000900D128|nr:PREDICTED: putative late blight resistance protein homolog R1B-16 [Ipomoea nil]